MHFDPVGTEQTSQADIREFTEDDALARQAREVARDDESRARAEDSVRARASRWHRRRRRRREKTDEDTKSRRRRRFAKDCPRASACGTRRTTSTSCSAMRRRGRCARFRSARSSRRSTTTPSSRISSSRFDGWASSSRCWSGRRGAIYRVIAGMRRLRAAQRVGLGDGAVPGHEVHEVDEGRLTDLRDAAMQRLTVPPPPAEPEPVEAPAPVQPRRSRRSAKRRSGSSSSPRCCRR